MIHAVIVSPEPAVIRFSEMPAYLTDQIHIRDCYPTGSAAAQALERNPADLIFWDIRPEGLAPLQKLRQAGHLETVVLFTDSTDFSLLEQALHLGIEDYILLPFAPSRLVHTLKNYLDRIRALRSGSILSQSIADQILHHPLPTETVARLLPKGLSQQTLSVLEQQLRDPSVSEYTCETLADACRLSRVTVRHYLNYLIEVGMVCSTIDYHTGGRPRILYQLVANFHI